MRANGTDDFALLDRPEVLSRLFYPRKKVPGVPVTPKAITHFVIHRKIKDLNLSSYVLGVRKKKLKNIMGL
jgi:hypothetical protein